MKKISTIFALITVIGMSDAMSDINMPYQWNGRIVKKAILNADFGKYTGKQMAEGVDATEISILGFEIISNEDEKKIEFGNSIERLVKCMDAKNFKCSVADAVKCCTGVFGRKECTSFAKNLVELAAEDMEETSAQVCSVLLASSTDGGYCGGHCDRIGGDKVYIMDVSGGWLFDTSAKVKQVFDVDDFCDGEKGGQYYWYEKSGKNVKKVTDKDTVDALTNAAKAHDD